MLQPHGRLHLHLVWSVTLAAFTSTEMAQIFTTSSILSSVGKTMCVKTGKFMEHKVNRQATGDSFVVEVVKLKEESLLDWDRQNNSHNVLSSAFSRGVTGHDTISYICNGPSPFSSFQPERGSTKRKISRHFLHNRSLEYILPYIGIIVNLLRSWLGDGGDSLVQKMGACSPNIGCRTGRLFSYSISWPWDISFQRSLHLLFSIKKSHSFHLFVHVTLSFYTTLLLRRSFPVAMKSFITAISVLSPSIALLASGRVIARAACPDPVASGSVISALPSTSSAPPAVSATSAPGKSSSTSVSPSSSSGSAPPSVSTTSAAAGGSCSLPSNFLWTDFGGPLAQPANGVRFFPLLFLLPGTPDTDADCTHSSSGFL